MTKPTAKQRLQIDRQKMTEQDPLVRNANFNEVNLGLPEKVALLEAERCLLCRDPKCISGCPVGVNIPRFIEFLWQGNLPEAAQCLLNDNTLPSITGNPCVKCSMMVPSNAGLRCFQSPSRLVMEMKSLPKKTRETSGVWNNALARGERPALSTLGKSATAPAPITSLPGRNFRVAGLGVDSVWINMGRA